MEHDSRLPRSTLRCLVGRSAVVSGAGAAEGAVEGEAVEASGEEGLGRGFHTVAHSLRSSRSAHALSLCGTRSKPSMKS